MTRINALRNTADSTLGTLHALAFAAVLIVCSFAVGCSDDKPKPVSSNTQIATTQPAPVLASTPAPVATPASKPATKKSATKKPATVNYTDKTNGVTFEYPRRYAIDTGDAARDLVLTQPIAMNFVAPGGIALAAVELPETGFDNTDFSSAFFNVSVHKDLTADQCAEFAVPHPKAVDVAQAPSPASADGSKPAVPSTEVKEETPSAASQPASTPDEPAVAKSTEPADSAPAAPLEFKDMQLHATEAVSGEGTHQSDSRYFHVYRNGSCYEFALNVTTNAAGDGLTKHVDREKIFTRLEKILDTVRLDSATPAVATEAPAAPSESPAQ